MNWDDHFAERARLMQQNTIREFLKHAERPGMISLAGGLPDAHFLPVDETRTAVDHALTKHGSRMLQYGVTEGIPGLREIVAARFKNAGATSENVLITTGSQQTLDLIGRVLLDDHSKVTVQNPTYLAALSAFRPYGARFSAGQGNSPLPEPGTENPDLIYCVANFHNPTGECLDVATRQELVRHSLRTETPLIEDDPYGELCYERTSPADSLLEIACNVRASVIHIGTFSKTLAPGFRIGWIVADAKLISKLALAKQSTDLHTSTFAQYTVLELLEMGTIERTLPGLRAEYSKKRDVLLDALEAQMPASVRWTRPAGGFFLLLRLPAVLDGALVAGAALEANVAIVPGREFHIRGGANTVRLCFSNSSPTEIEEGVARLSRVIAHYQ